LQFNTENFLIRQIKSQTFKLDKTDALKFFNNSLFKVDIDPCCASCRGYTINMLYSFNIDSRNLASLKGEILFAFLLTHRLFYSFDKD